MEGVNDWSTSSLQTLLNSGDYYNSIGDYQAIGFSEKSKEKNRSSDVEFRRKCS